jgi:RNA polymerase sigma factor (sigma-70 family)
VVTTGRLDPLLSLSVLPITIYPLASRVQDEEADILDLRSPDDETWTADVAGHERPIGSLPAMEQEVHDQAVPAAVGTGLSATVPEPRTFDLTEVSPGASTPTSLQAMSVAGLVEKARLADAGAWEELVGRFGGMIAATGRRFRLTAPDVAELQQTTWLRLVENLHRIEQPERIGGWLATTARRESLQLLKRASKYHSGADQMLANMPDRHLPEPDARPIAEEREAVVRAAWDRLKPRCQQLLSLLMSDDPLGYKDLSKLLQMPVGSIGPTRARCLEHLRRLVEEEGMVGA